jgi:hypothetical protein
MKFFPSGQHIDPRLNLSAPAGTFHMWCESQVILEFVVLGGFVSHQWAADEIYTNDSQRQRSKKRQTQALSGRALLRWQWDA